MSLRVVSWLDLVVTPQPTPCLTCYTASMTKIKRTYNLSPMTVGLVRRLAEESHVAPTQDAVVEAAVQSLGRRVRDEEHVRQFAVCARDPEFQREMTEIGTEFEADDRAAWEVG